MIMSKHKKMPSYEFPQELLSEIFKRLPVKYVLRCRAVQKSWYALIKSPVFISLYCNHKKLTAHIDSKYLLFDDQSTHVMTIRSDDAHCQEYCTFSYPQDLPLSSWYTMSNGLICVSTMFDESYDYNCDIYIWNPLVKKFKTVPETPLSTFEFEEIEWSALAFGFLPEHDDYVVVHVVKPGLICESDNDELYEEAYKQYLHSVVIGVYSLNTNSWKKICQDKVFVDSMCSNRSVFVNGTAIWVGYNSRKLHQFVFYFDTKTNILREVELPCWVFCNYRQLESPLIFEFGQSIAYFVGVNQEDVIDDYGSPHLDIWVSKGDMIGEFSWEGKRRVALSENVWVEVLGIRNNGEPILAKANTLISYDLDTHKPYDFVDSCDRLSTSYSYKEGSRLPFAIRPFVETLVLLDVDRND